jgi:hypothetical protein
MKIINEVNNETIRQACGLVQLHFKDKDLEDFFNDVKFNYTTNNGNDVCWNSLNFEETVYVKPYTSLSPWSKVIGYATDNTIYINTRKLDLPLKDRIENIRHECYHLQGYSHKGNKVTEFNLKTVPYLGANLFVKYLESVGKV